MNWEAIGALAELVGAAIVALSLIYVVRQFHQQSAESEQRAFGSSYLGMADHLNYMFGPQNAELLVKGFRDFDGLEPAEKLRFDMLMANLMNFAEAGFRASKAGVLEDALETWRWFLRECIFAYPGTRAWWTVSGELFPPDVREWLDDEVRNAAIGSDRYGLSSHRETE